VTVDVVLYDAPSPIGTQGLTRLGIEFDSDAHLESRRLKSEIETASACVEANDGR
jgi:hypothetical protein